MPRLKQRRQNIQYGGTKVSVRDSLKTSFEAIIDEGQVALALLQHCESIEYMDIKSYGAVLFIVKLPENSSSLVMVESQTESNDNTKLKFIESTHIEANIGKGKRYNKVCMKIILSNPTAYESVSTNGPFYDKGQQDTKLQDWKEVTPDDTPEHEKQHQKEIFEELLCSSQIYGDIIPDAIGFKKMTPQSFYESEESKYAKLIGEKTKQVFDWIKTVSQRFGLNINVFFMDYIDDYQQFRTLLPPDPSNELLIRNIAIKTVAGILAIICITRYYSKDIHPGNVMFNNTKSDNLSDVQVKLIDFGQVSIVTPNLPSSIQRKYNYKKSIFNEKQLFTSQIKYVGILSKIYSDVFDIFLDKSRFIGLGDIERREIVFKVIIFYIFFIGLNTAVDQRVNSVRCDSFMIYIFYCKPHALSSFTNFLTFFNFDYNATLNELHAKKLCADDSLTFDQYKQKCDDSLDAICKCITDMLITSCSWSMARPELLRGIIPHDQLQELNDDARDYTKNKQDAARFYRMRFNEKVMYPGGPVKYFQNKLFKRHLDQVKRTITADRTTGGSIKKNKHKSQRNRRSNNRNHKSSIRNRNRNHTFRK